MCYEPSLTNIFPLQTVFCSPNYILLNVWQHSRIKFNNITLLNSLSIFYISQVFYIITPFGGNFVSTHIILISHADKKGKILLNNLGYCVLSELCHPAVMCCVYVVMCVYKIPWDHLLLLYQPYLKN